MIRRFPLIVSALVAVSTAAACDQGVGPRTPANASFVISQTPASGAVASLIALDDSWVGWQDGQRGVRRSDIESIDIRATGIAALPIGNDSIEDSDWVKLMAPSPVELNLLALPTNPDSGLQVTRGSLPAGMYGHLRILFDSSSITFAKTITLIRGMHVRTFQADSAYPLYIGGFGMPDTTQATDEEGETLNHFGIVVPAQTFTVANDSSATISIVFNADATVQRVIVTPRGLFLAPVINAVCREERYRYGQDD